MERKPACSSGANPGARRGERAGRTGYMEKDLTSGSVLKNIFTFSLPYLLSYFLQTLYGMADLFIIGRFEGVASTTAVSIGSQVMHMITVILVGVAMGTTVCIGRSVGAGDKKQAAKVIGNTVTLFMVGSVVLAAALVGLVDPIVRLISTPEEAVAGTTAYLTICFIGIPCITAYNVLASIFRGMGDSRSPMYFIAAACVVNIGLDFFFMGTLRLGPAGAALGTTLSQAVSVLLALCVILKRKSIRLSKSDFCPRKATMKDILSIGLPVAAQDGFIQVSFMLITIMANQRGLTDAAAVGIVEKIISFLFLVPSSMLSTVSALGAQNIGAGQYDRVQAGIRAALSFMVAFSLAMVAVMFLFGRNLVGLFVDEPVDKVLSTGAFYLKLISIGMVPFSFFNCFNGVARGAGYMPAFTISTLSDLAVRVAFAYLFAYCFPSVLGENVIAVSVIVGWCVGTILSVAFHCSGRWKHARKI